MKYEIRNLEIVNFDMGDFKNSKNNPRTTSPREILLGFWNNPNKHGLSLLGCWQEDDGHNDIDDYDVDSQ